MNGKNMGIMKGKREIKKVHFQFPHLLQVHFNALFRVFFALTVLEEHNLTRSMSRSGNQYNNACAESFFTTLKKKWAYHRKY